jgi:hypothetical protein
MFSSHLEFRTMGKVNKPSDSEETFMFIFVYFMILPIDNIV